MKHQLCRNCGHRHQLGAPCIFKDKPQELTAPVLDRARKEIAADPSLTITPTRVEKAETIPEKFERMATERGFEKLTPAEKQKAYRERDPERKREANRLRMVAKRKGD